MLGERLIAILGGDAGRRAEIDALLAATRVANVPAPDAAFVDAVAARIGSIDELAGLQLADLLVAHHAARGHAGALAAVRQLLDGLRGQLRRTGADAQQIDELLADLPSELLAPRDGTPPRILGYGGKGPLGGWLRVVAVRAMIDRRRKAGHDASDDDVAELAAPQLDPELALLRRQYAAAFKTAFTAAIAGLSAGDRLLLRQHHLDGLGIDRLAVLHGCHRATAARRLVAVRELVFDAVRRRLLSDLKIGGQTFDSLLRVAQSELDLSILRYL